MYDKCPLEGRRTDSNSSLENHQTQTDDPSYTYVSSDHVFFIGGSRHGQGGYWDLAKSITLHGVEERR